MNFSISSERLIDSMHAPKRVDGVDYLMCPDPIEATTSIIRHKMNNSFNSPLSSGFLYHAFRRRLNVGVAVEKYQYPMSAIDRPEIKKAVVANDIDEWMKLVRGASTIKAIFEGLCPLSGRNTTVNIENICMQSTKPTIEFRQHEGTMETDRVLSYVDFVTKMVSYCQNHNWDELKTHIGTDGSLRRVQSTFLDLCRSIGCKQSSLAYYDSMSDYSIVKQIRHEERKDARDALRDSRLAIVAVNSIDYERTTLNPENRERTVRKKFSNGGYGKWPRSFVDRLVEPSTPENQRRCMTLDTQYDTHPMAGKYDISLFKLSKDHRIPSAGSSAHNSPNMQPGPSNVQPVAGSAEARGRGQLPAGSRTPGQSPITLPEAAYGTDQRTESRRSSPAMRQSPASTGSGRARSPAIRESPNPSGSRRGSPAIRQSPDPTVRSDNRTPSNDRKGSGKQR
jgi:hypothetical protein